MDFKERIEESDRWSLIFTPPQVYLLESWQNTEVEDIPEYAKIPIRMLYEAKKLSHIPPHIRERIIESEFFYIKNTDLFTFSIIQKEAFNHIYIPSSGALLFCSYEYKRLLNHNRRNILRINTVYPHHITLKRMLTDGLYSYSYSEDYLKTPDKEGRKKIILDDIWYEFVKDLEISLKKGILMLLKEEISSKGKSPHRARIATDILNRLSRETVDFLYKSDPKFIEYDSFIKDFFEEFSTLPDWMVEYGYKMSQINIIEEDIKFLNEVIPFSLKLEVNHRGFVKFIFPQESNINSGTAHRIGSSRAKRSLRVSESLMKRLEMMFQKERETIFVTSGRKIDNKRIALEVSTLRGKLFKKFNETNTPDISFILLLDISKSVRRKGYLGILHSTMEITKASLEKLGIPFVIGLFNENINFFKDSPDNINLEKLAGGKTNLEKAIRESLNVKRRDMSDKNTIMLIFTDGEPTLGLKEEALKDLIKNTKITMPVIGIGMKGFYYLKYYFEDSCVEMENIEDFPIALTRTLEKFMFKLYPRD